MWFVIVLAALVVIAGGLVLRRRRSASHSRPSFSELSRDEQVQIMRNVEGGATRHGDREGAKHRNGGRSSESLGPGV
jgi:hypothetical protein